MDRKNFIVNRIAPTSTVLNIGCCGDDRDFDKTWHAGNALHQVIANIVGIENLIGIDINSKRIEQMQKMGYYAEEHSAENLLTLTDNYEKRFDVIVAGDIIEHLSSPGLFLESAKSVLKPDGYMLITTPNIYAFWFWFLYGVLGWIEPWPEHVHYHTPCTLRQIFDRHAWKIQEWHWLSYGNQNRRFRILKAIPELIERMRPCIGVVVNTSRLGSDCPDGK